MHARDMLSTHHRQVLLSSRYHLKSPQPGQCCISRPPPRQLCRTISHNQRCLTRCCVSLPSAGDAAYTGDTGLHDGHFARTIQLQAGVRPAMVQDYWAIAEVHAQSFYPTANWIFAPLLRIDRVVALQMGTDNELKGKQGNFQCFVAYDLNADSSINSCVQNSHTPGADVPFFFKFLLAEHLRAGFEVSPASIGLLGAVVVDMQGTFLPAERVEKGPFVAYERPRDVAYISNLAVIPQARRQGVGEQLLLAAENAAKDWGCKRLALHCDATNEAAVGLYKKHDYATVSKEGPWQSFLQGRQVRLELMARHIA